MAKAPEDKMSKIISLCKRRGFIFPSSEIYGGLASCYDYGPLGVELKRNMAHRASIEAALNAFISEVLKTTKGTLVLYQNSYIIPE